MPEIECAICHGKSGEEPGTGMRVCDFCLGKKSLPPGHHLYQEEEIEPMEEQAIMEITPVVKEATCPGPCGRTMPLEKEYWYSDRSRANGFKRFCKQCQSTKNAADKKRMCAATKIVQQKAKEIELDSKAMLPVIPTEVIIPLGKDKAVFSSERISVKVIDFASSPFLAIEGHNEEFTGADDPAINEHQFFMETEDQIDRLAETLKSIMRQVNVTYGG